MEGESNGQPRGIVPDPARPGWQLTRDQAERMIQELYSGYRQTFGKIMREIWTLETGTRAGR